jgi:predicted ATPase
MRGQAMIRLFMGHPTSALEALERAIEAFNTSGEEDRLAARAAGQDAAVADLALMSWALWLLGRVDTAIAQLNTAIRRADAIDHPHSQAYACYYAAVLHALRGEMSEAQDYAERCLTLSDEHGFRQWRGLAHAIRGICVTLLDPSSSAIEEVRGALDEYRGAGYQLGITALYVLLCQALLSSHKYEAALDLIEQGFVTAGRNSEQIFEAELYRLKARVLLARGGSDVRSAAQALLEQALATARGQQARTLELRAASDLAALWNDQGRRKEALDLLAPVYAGFTEGCTTPDVTQARELLDRVR